MPRPMLPKPDTRELEKSFTDRVKWEPGEPHKHDVLFQEARAAGEEVVPALETFLTTIKKIEQLLTTISTQETLTDSDALTTAETPVQQAIQQRFESRRHFAHLAALFAILRRRNLLGRLYVAQAALELAQALLEDPDTIWQDFLQATDVTEAQMQQHLMIQEQAREENREQVSKEEEEPEHKNIRGARGSLKPLIGSVESARHALSAFAQRLPEFRSHLIQRTGRIEIFYVNQKTRFRSEVLALRKAIRRAERDGTPLDQIDQDLVRAVHPQVAEHLLTKGLRVPIPKALEHEAYHFDTFGPYGKLRIKGIRATKGIRKGYNYAISFGPKDRTPGYILARYIS